MQNERYLKQAELLLRVLPHIAREEVFALKGGTAINFFWRDFPRLSVDIDLTYLPIQERELSLVDISDRLASIQVRLERIFPQIKITQKLNDKKIYGLILNLDGATVKVEPNTTIRGTVFPVVSKKLCTKAEEKFELSIAVNTLSLEDLYGGKICAALDRQHPRDLFDVKLLTESEGITVGIVKAFVFYLISHDRPIVELLNPGLKDMSQSFENEFAGMTTDEVKLEELISVRGDLISKIKTSLSDEQKKFILSFKNKRPEWKLSGIDGIENYPSVKWKLMNLEKMEEKKHAAAYEKLKEYLVE
ncbi:MAG TPA: nucleotidyl transferase AbiEii/AbiGii toxin family protein [Ignavibacteriaceae bacterium]|nr:nucleotidyl transferase AbiEii/AbiGii toxin family protein [Ignavibacteriaceae bacterium]